jgi:hypothetical protein
LTSDQKSNEREKNFNHLLSVECLQKSFRKYFDRLSYFMEEFYGVSNSDESELRAIGIYLKWVDF